MLHCITCFLLWWCLFWFWSMGLIWIPRLSMLSLRCVFTDLCVLQSTKLERAFLKNQCKPLIALRDFSLGIFLHQCCASIDEEALPLWTSLLVFLGYCGGCCYCMVDVLIAIRLMFKIKFHTMCSRKCDIKVEVGQSVYLYSSTFSTFGFLIS